jgi:torulene dioxygenase
LTSLPEWAHGSFIVSGPAKFEMGGIKFQGIFDGYGRVNRFELREGEACYTSAWLNTSYYMAAEKLGEIGPGVLFEGTTPDRPTCPKPFCDIGAPMDNNWINLLPVAGEGLLLSDSPLMLNLDVETLAVSGEHAWDDGPGMKPSWMSKSHVGTMGSAHPIRRPKTEATYVALMLSMSIMPLEPNYVSIYSIDTTKGKRRDLIANIPVKGLQYFHSYGVTEHYVVLPCNMRMTARLEDLIGRPYMLDNFEEGWDGIYLVDLEGNAQKFETDKFFHVHVSNTFENETGVVMDVGAFTAIPFSKSPQLDIALFNNKTARDGVLSRGELRRYVFHLEGEKKGQVTWQVVSAPGREVDFFKINDRWNGLPYCYVYSDEWFHDGETYASMAVVKQNVCTGERTYWKAKDNYPGEPFFIPGPGPEEDDGLVIFVVLDGPKGISKLMVLDGKTFNEVATIELPVHIPFTAHGQFIRAAALKASKALEEGNLLRDVAYLV